MGEKALSRVLIIEQNLLDVYLLRSTGHLGNDFVTHPGGFCRPFQRGPKGLVGVPMLRLPLGELPPPHRPVRPVIDARLQTCIIQRKSVCTRALSEEQLRGQIIYHGVGGILGETVFPRAFGGEIALHFRIEIYNGMPSPFTVNAIGSGVAVGGSGVNVAVGVRVGSGWKKRSARGEVRVRSEKSRISE